MGVERREKGKKEEGGTKISDAHCQLPTRKLNKEVIRKLEVTPIDFCAPMVIRFLYLHKEISMN